jgi:uncharacterized protein
VNRTAGKRCVVAYATPARQYLWTVDLPPDATIADALAAARRSADEESRARLPWDTAPVGIFGQPRSRSELPRDGDRIEIYRPLQSDPRERRRDRVQSARKKARSR